MSDLTITLTKTDRVVLESYKSFAEGLCEYLGSSYEFVLHSLENIDKSVIKIINGYHTDRSEGAPITDLALEMLSKINESNGTPYISYFANNKKGEPLRSTTILIKGEKNRTIGLLCINFYLNSPFIDVISPFLSQKASQSSFNENFANNPEEIIEEAVSHAKKRVFEDNTITASMKIREITKELYNNGVFSLKNSVIQTAELLGISKNTVYMHLRYFKSKQQQ